MGLLDYERISNVLSDHTLLSIMTEAKSPRGSIRNLDTVSFIHSKLATRPRTPELKTKTVAHRHLRWIPVQIRSETESTHFQFAIERRTSKSTEFDNDCWHLSDSTV